MAALAQSRSGWRIGLARAAGRAACCRSDRTTCSPDLTFNSKMAVVTFGGAYAVLAYMAQQAVEHYHWLKAGEMLVGLGFAETTPGPLISVVQFVGFMAAFRHPGLLPPATAGIFGGALAMWCTFVPPFIWIFVGGPYVESLIGNKSLNAALSGSHGSRSGCDSKPRGVVRPPYRYSAQVGETHWWAMSLNVPALSTINWAALAIAAAAMVAIFRFKIGMMPVLAVSCLAGIVLHPIAGSS